MRGFVKFWSPSPHSSPIGDCVAILKPHECHSEPQAKNLTIPTFYKRQILWLPPQDDIATQSLEGEDFTNLSCVKKVFAGLVVALAVALGASSVGYAANLERVRVGYSVGGLIPFPVVVARENNFFEPLGLEIELDQHPSDTGGDGAGIRRFAIRDICRNYPQCGCTRIPG